jgi:hypothetical protein
MLNPLEVILFLQFMLKLLKKTNKENKELRLENLTLSILQDLKDRVKQMQLEKG